MECTAGVQGDDRAPQHRRLVELPTTNGAGPALEPDTGAPASHTDDHSTAGCAAGKYSP